MIYGDIKNIGNEYKVLPDVLKKAIDFLKSTDFSKIEAGKHSLEGFDKEKMFAVVAEYETKPKKKAIAEQHNNFIDVQFIVSGEESIGVGFENSKNKVSQEYSNENDAALYSEVAGETYLTMLQGNFAVFFPEDIHRPGCDLKTKSKVRKIVVKISTELL